MVGAMVEVFDRIQNDLARLRKADRRLQVFGASQHRYRSTPVSTSSVEQFEHGLGVELPQNYREFLLRIGYGCGPYYGIWSPAEILRELESWSMDSDPCPRCSPSGKFPLKSAEAGIQCEDWPNDGCIPIGHQGCTFWTVLVLDGAFRGTVWDVACFVGFDGEWAPARRPVTLLDERNPIQPLGSPPDFLEWIESWIESCRLNFVA